MNKKELIKKGRQGIGSISRSHYSKRAMDGNLEVIRLHCPHCGHHKALKTITRTKCARCKKEIGGDKNSRKKYKKD